MLYVPEPSLAALAKERGITISTKNKRILAEELVQSLEAADLWQIVTHSVRTGRSVVSWYLPQQPVAELTRDSVQDSLITHYDANPFEIDLEFDLTSVPEVASGMWLTDDVALLELIRGKEIYEWDRLSLRPRLRTMFSRAILRMGATFLECWGDSESAQASGGRLGLILGLGEPQQVTLNDAELDQLTSDLAARITLARVKDDSGNYDTYEVTADPMIGDLQQVQDYQTGIAGKPSIRRVIEFDPPSGGPPVRLEITRSSGFWFRGYVAEEVVDDVLSVVRALKGF